LNRVTVSIHGPDAVVHDGLTGVRGSFDQTLRGLRNLAAARPARRLELHTSSVVVRRNLPHLAALRHLLEELAVDRMCFNVMMAKGRGLERLETLMPRYRDVAGTFRALVAPLSVEARRRVSLADIPRCCVRGIPVEVVGEQERFQQFERTDSLGVSGIAHEDLGARAAGDGPDRDAARRLLERSAAADLAGDGRYYLTTRELKDGLLRTRRDLCSECRYDAVCPGVWTAYTEAWGWDEFEPVRPAAGVPEKGA
ncbi:MAG: hypothetical protein FJ098_15675, partial [Deltaproteobacteria bacterium]|nr:hypothetical protein [Deltaproteobacteria bacterium]